MFVVMLRRGFSSTAWLFKIAVHKLLSVARQSPVLPGTDIGWKNTFRGIVYGFIPNRRYADGVITLVRSIYESCRQLKVDFKSVELSNWLMFQQSELEYPAKSITLKPGYEFHITTVDYSKNSYRDVVKPVVPKSYRTSPRKGFGGEAEVYRESSFKELRH
jgi:hypothetical protein